MKPIVLAFCAASALSLAGCTSSQQVAASKERLNSTVRAVVGTSLVGAQGKTREDQEKIDDTSAGLCGAKVWTQSECQRHGSESRR